MIQPDFVGFIRYNEGKEYFICIDFEEHERFLYTSINKLVDDIIHIHRDEWKENIQYTTHPESVDGEIYRKFKNSDIKELEYYLEEELYKSEEVVKNANEILQGSMIK